MKNAPSKILAAASSAILLGLGAAYSQTGTPFFRVSPDGKVGVGTASPAYRLDVVGDINLTGCLRKGSAILAGQPCAEQAGENPPAEPAGGGGLNQRVATLERQLQEMQAQMAALQRRVAALEARR